MVRRVFYLYIIECIGGSLYTGITTDVERRFKEHLWGKGGNYTSSHTPKRVVYTEKCGTRSDALKREAEIKTFPRKEKILLIQTGSPVDV
ncbi:MAG: GIY-YIG nuclease family protein [Candidatus Colwellbacteria bacterium]|nr:GIY-YIG nuclease family protein [Candidatus Colwellbacteria bacterium]